jgi:hypothetical protein
VAGYFTLYCFYGQTGAMLSQPGKWHRESP